MTPVVSERIHALEKSLTENPDALMDLLDEIKAQGTPLVEVIPGYNRFVWVTHFYYTNQEIDNVVVYETHMPFNEERAVLEPIADTGLYAKTTIVPFDQRVYYGFSINDSLEVNCSKRQGQIISDPFNHFADEMVADLVLSMVQTPQKVTTEEGQQSMVEV